MCKSKIALLAVLVLTTSPAHAGIIGKIKKIPHIVAFTVKHPIKSTYNIGEWNEKSHFGSFLSLLGNAGMISAGVSRL